MSEETFVLCCIGLLELTFVFFIGVFLFSFFQIDVSGGRARSLGHPVESRAMRVTFAWRPSYPGSTWQEFVVVGSPGFGRPEFCCERMGEAWKAQAIQFGGWNGTL